METCVQTCVQTYVQTCVRTCNAGMAHLDLDLADGDGVERRADVTLSENTRLDRR